MTCMSKMMIDLSYVNKKLGWELALYGADGRHTKSVMFAFKWQALAKVKQLLALESVESARVWNTRRTGFEVMTGEKKPAEVDA
jgi:hypothetical protein